MARDPDNLHKSYEYVDEIPTIININNIPIYDRSDYDLADSNVVMKKFLPSVERICRNSFEYKRMVMYLRQYMDMHKCAFYEKLDNLESTKVHIEIHHEPLSLFDICRIIYNKRVYFNEPLDDEWIAKEAMYIHYKLQVGLIPLAETIHELVHNQYLFVPTTKVLGKYKEFINAYSPWIPEELQIVLDHIEKVTKTCDEEEYKDILAKNYVYVNMGNTLPKMEDLALLIKDRITEIMNNKQ